MPTRFVYQIVGLACVLVLPCLGQQAAPNVCPLKFSGAQYIGRKFVPLYGPGASVRAGDLSFRYTNISGRDIAGFTVRAGTESVVVGPIRPAMVGTGVDVDVTGLIVAGKSKRKKTRVSLSSSTWGVSLWLKNVTFADGHSWENTDPSQCVFAPRSSGVAVSIGPV